MENRTELTVNDMEKLNTYSFFKNMIFMTVLCVIIIICGISMIILKVDDNSLGYGIALIIFGTILTPLSYVVTVFGQKRQLKKNNLNEGFAYEYKFSKDGFQVRAISKNLDQKKSLKFNEIVRVSIKEECVYLFISKQQAYIVKYEGFNSESEKNNFLTLLNNLTRK